MILIYGGYRHAQDECQITRSLDRELGPGGEVIRIRRSWQISGQIHAENYVVLQLAKLALETAYSQNYRDFYLFHNDGVTLHDSLLNAGSTSGVIITSGPNYPVGEGAQGGTFLDYTISAQATAEAPTTLSEQMENFAETVQESGGGSRFVVVETVDGDPVRQMVNRKTKYRYTQSGTATGRSGYPPVPSPIWPSWENQAERSITRTSPQREGQRLTSYGISWSYVFESTEPLGGLPNVWII